MVAAAWGARLPPPHQLPILAPRRAWRRPSALGTTDQCPLLHGAANATRGRVSASATSPFGHRLTAAANCVRTRTCVCVRECSACGGREDEEGEGGGQEALEVLQGAGAGSMTACCPAVLPAWRVASARSRLEGATARPRGVGRCGNAPGRCACGHPPVTHPATALLLAELTTPRPPPPLLLPPCLHCKRCARRCSHRSWQSRTETDLARGPRSSWNGVRRALGGSDSRVRRRPRRNHYRQGQQ